MNKADVAQMVEKQDCQSCRIIGTCTGLGLSMYCFYERSRVPNTFPSSGRIQVNGVEWTVRSAKIHKSMLLAMGGGISIYSTILTSS